MAPGQEDGGGTEPDRSRRHGLGEAQVLGFITDMAHQGLPGLDVFICPLAAALEKGIRNPPGLTPEDLLPVFKAAKTDASGEFRVDGLGLGEHLLMAWSPEHLPVEERLVLEKGKNRIRLAAKAPAYTIGGRTEDAMGKPLGGVTLTALRSIGREDFSSRSDLELLKLQLFSEQEQGGADGRFLLLGLSPGEFDVYGEKEGFAPTVRQRVRAGTQDLVVTMTQAASIVGFVRDEGGRPIPGALVGANNYFGGGNVTSAARVEAKEDGSYLLPAVQAGGCAVEVAAEALGFARVQVGISPLAGGESRRLDFALPRAVSTAGKVVSPEGRPLPGAEVFFGPVERAGYLSLSPLSTDAEGRFEISNTEKGKAFFILVRKEGFDDGLFRPVEGGSRDLLLVMKPRFRVLGSLVAADGTRQFDAFTVEAFQEDEHGERAYSIRQGFPPGDGWFELPGVSPRQNGLVVWVPGFAPSFVQDLPARLGGRSVDLNLEVPLVRGRLVRGVLHDAESGRPVEGAKVQAVAASRRGRLRSQGPLVVESDSRGAFRIEGPDSGIAIRHPSYATLVRKIVPPAEGNTVDLGVIRLTPGGSLLARAADAAGEPIPGVEISFRTLEREWESAGLTDPAGTLLVPRLAPGSYEVSAWDWGSVYQRGRPYGHSRPVQVEEGKQTGVVFRLEEGEAVLGRVTWGRLSDPLQPPEAGVFLEDLPSERRFWAKVRGDGSFWIPGVLPGDYTATLRSFHLPRRFSPSRPVRVATGVENFLEFRLSGSGLAGAVTDALSGAALDFALLEILPVGRPGGDLVYSQADGSFGAFGLTPGAFRIRASKRGYAVDTIGPFDVGENRVTEGLLVALFPQGLLRVVVRARTGEPIPASTVRLHDEAQELKTGLDGVAVFEQLKAGRYRVEVDALGFARETSAPAVVLMGRQTEILVAPRRLCVLIASLKATGGELPSAATFTLVGAESDEILVRESTLSGGEARLAEIPEGTWKVSAKGEGGGRVGEATTAVLPNQENFLTITIK